MTLVTSVGSGFDYEHYRGEQVLMNRAKFGRVSFSQAEVDAVADFFRARFRSTQADDRPIALCQGVRNGAEVRAFRRALRARVIGTDISPTVWGVRDGFLCDFHSCPALWQSQVAFMYSNSWDHSFDLDELLRHWHSLLHDGGWLFLQHTPAHTADTRVTAGALHARLEANGFKRIEWIEVPVTSPFVRRIVLALWHRIRRSIGLPPLPSLAVARGTRVVAATRN